MTTSSQNVYNPETTTGLWPQLTQLWRTPHGALQTLLDNLQAPAALLARLYMAQVFFLSGLTKLRDWGTTLALFQNEYKVPLLPPELAASRRWGCLSST